MDASAPPMYDSGFEGNSVSASVSTPNTELPAYTGRRTPSSPRTTRRRPLSTEHVFQLLNTESPWATLNILSNARSATQLPSFTEGDNIAGSLSLDLRNVETVHSIVISVKGTIITAVDPGGCYEFLDCVQTLWSKSMGDPRQSGSTQGKFNGKLFGTYLWPFSFQLPVEVYVPRLKGLPPQSFRLPQTFRERHTRPSVQYELDLCITRGKLRSNSHLKTALVYVSCTKPDPPTMLRQLAYQENSPLLGPEADPEGWKSMPFQVRGTIFNARTVQANCILSLATPLCYSKGTAIPCIISIETPDSQAMDLLSSPRAIDVRLRRCVTYRENAGIVKKMGSGSSEIIEDITTAVWWPSQDGHTTKPGQRRLNGEMQLSNALKPTSAIAHFAIEYLVVVMPFQPTAFISADTDILLSERVEIATMLASGPRAKIYSPPGYKTSSSSLLKSQDIQNYFGAAHFNIES